MGGDYRGREENTIGNQGKNRRFDALARACARPTRRGGACAAAALLALGADPNATSLAGTRDFRRCTSPPTRGDGRRGGAPCRRRGAVRDGRVGNHALRGGRSERRARNHRRRGDSRGRGAGGLFSLGGGARRRRQRRATAARAARRESSPRAWRLWKKKPRTTARVMTNRSVSRIFARRRLSRRRRRTRRLASATRRSVVFFARGFPTRARFARRARADAGHVAASRGHAAALEALEGAAVAKDGGAGGWAGVPSGVPSDGGAVRDSAGTGAGGARDARAFHVGAPEWAAYSASDASVRAASDLRLGTAGEWDSARRIGEARGCSRRAARLMEVRAAGGA